MQIEDLEKKAKEKREPQSFAGVIVEYVQEQFRYWIDKDMVTRDRAAKWLWGGGC